MKVKELLEQLAGMDQEAEVVLSIYQPGDSGEQDHYESIWVVEYKDKNGFSVQIKGE